MTSKRLRTRWWIWFTYVLLFGASIPWYLPKNDSAKIWFGFPHWVLISLLATLCIAVFTVVVMARLWPDQEKSIEGKHE